LKVDYDMTMPSYQKILCLFGSIVLPGIWLFYYNSNNFLLLWLGAFPIFYSTLCAICTIVLDDEQPYKIRIGLYIGTVVFFIHSVVSVMGVLLEDQEVLPGLMLIAGIGILFVSLIMSFSRDGKGFKLKPGHFFSKSGIVVGAIVLFLFGCWYIRYGRLLESLPYSICASALYSVPFGVFAAYAYMSYWVFGNGRLRLENRRPWLKTGRPWLELVGSFVIMAIIFLALFGVFFVVFAFSLKGLGE
jgi:hypothetical protein